MAVVDPPYAEFAASGPSVPVVISSPHSGTLYPDGLAALLRIGGEELRALDDGPLDRLAAVAAATGASALCARYARAYVDLTRAPDELDPELVDGPLPARVASVRVKAGLGVIPSRLGNRPIWRRPLDPSEVAERLEAGWYPYHARLAELLAERRRLFGTVLLLDLHSMPTEVTLVRGRRPLDVAIGDCHGRACEVELVRAVETTLAAAGLACARNTPYAGGYITERWGRPAEGLCALQLEFRRSLFMDEATGAPTAGLAALAALVETLVARVAAILAPPVLRAAE
ncbi:MAG: N-formylglutamate amidohydrolase [Geminicoccaceae bacterium]|nr:N-formylglutamate amidohydrolase [Geminicoccaceae bacterium]